MKIRLRVGGSYICRNGQMVGPLFSLPYNRALLKCKQHDFSYGRKEVVSGSLILDKTTPHPWDIVEVSDE